MFNTPSIVKQFRKHFPFLQNHTELAYLDNAATTHKPQVLMDSMCAYYTHTNANVHRASHNTASKTTLNFENSRSTLAKFINAKHKNEVIWTKGTTESINMVASGLAHLFEAGDEIILSTLEHHANFVPWQQLAQAKQIKLHIVPIIDGRLDLDAYHQLLGPKTKLLALCHVSNALGLINPIKQMIKAAKTHGALTLIDGAQAIAHLDVDVQDLDCDYYCFSAHKFYGPTGLGILYGKTEALDKLLPTQYGGEMVDVVTPKQTTWAQLPHRLEPGTPNIAAVIGFAELIDFVEKSDRKQLQNYEAQLYRYLQSELSKIKGLTVIGHGEKCASISFTLDNWHPQDAGELLDQMGIAIRVGSHCAQPLMQALAIEQGTLRASICAYTSVEDVNKLISALKQLDDFL